MMNTRYQSFSKTTGLSMVELMVALAVSAILLLGVGTVFTASKRSYQTNDEIAAMQENARFALHTLTQNIRMAGYTGCQLVGVDGVTNNIEDPDNAGQPHPAYNVTVDSLAVGHRDTGSWTPPLPTTPANIVPDTDAISIRRTTNCSQKLAADMNGPNDPVIVSNTVNCNYGVDQAVIVTDCRLADIFMITGTTPAGPNLELEHSSASNLADNFEGVNTYTVSGNAFVLSLFSTLYYIGTNPAGGRSLYEVTDGGNPAELVPNVENMVIRLGLNTNEETDNSVDTIRFANGIAATEWRQVVNVYVRLLLTSDLVGTTNKVYSFDGVTFDGSGGNALPTDTRYRKEFFTTINLRNKAVRSPTP